MYILQICFNDFNTAAIEIPRGLDQGCPLSGISYQFYNTGLIEVPNQHKGEDCIGFVDDTMILAEGADLQEACDKLTSIMTRPGGVLDWAKDHECHFVLDKFGLMGLTRKGNQTRQEQGKPVPKPIPASHQGSTQSIRRPPTSSQAYSQIKNFASKNMPIMPLQKEANTLRNTGDQQNQPRELQLSTCGNTT